MEILGMAWLPHSGNFVAVPGDNQSPTVGAHYELLGNAGLGVLILKQLLSTMQTLVLFGYSVILRVTSLQGLCARYPYHSSRNANLGVSCVLRSMPGAHQILTAHLHTPMSCSGNRTRTAPKLVSWNI